MQMNKNGTPETWTIYDIAREAGVSAKTVSRVLNNGSGVAEGTRQRILDVMKRVSYHPHIGARGLRANRTHGCVGVTVPAPMDIVPMSQGFFLWLFTELFRIFGLSGEYLCLDMNPYSVSPDADYSRSLLERLCKALVIAGPIPLNDKVIFRVHASGTPYLAFGRLESLPECSSATVDYVEGAYLSTRYMLARGHKRIGMLRALASFQAGVDRERGYCLALEEAGQPYDANLIRSVRFGAGNIANVVHRILNDSSITALIDCSATEDASSLREGARRAGRVPGKDFEIIAWTYAESAAVLSEASAHVWLPVREVATDGLEQLAEWIRGERDGPINILYHPLLSEKKMEELPKPRRLFDMKD
jgi:LacI family transcriptional regulator